MTEQISRRRFLQLTALSTAGVVMVACAPATAPGAAPVANDTQTAGGEKATVRFHSRTGVQGDYYTEMAQKFNEENPDINVTVEAFPGENPVYLQKIATMIAGGTVGDAMWAASIHNFYNYAAANTYAVLDDFVAADSYDLGQFYPVGVEACKYDGKMYGLPWIVHPGRHGLYYNKTAFEKAGLDVPSEDWTYDDLATVAVAMTQKEGDNVTQYGFLPETDYFGLISPIRSFGGDWMNKEGTTMTVDAPEAVAGLKQWEQFYQDLGVSPAGVSGADKPQIWASGRVIMIQSGYWGQSWGKNNVKDFEWMVAPMPKGPAGSHCMFEFDPNVILASSKVQPQAWEFLKYLSTKEAGVRIAEMGSVPGGRPDVWNDPRLAEYPPHMVFTKIMETIDPLVLPNNFRSEELFQIATNVLDPVWLGSAKVEDVIADLTSSMQAVLDMPRI